MTQAEAGVSQSPDIERALQSAQAERDAFVAYGEQLEKRFKAVLRSSSWRMTGPMRVGVRSVRRVLGKPTRRRHRLSQPPAVERGMAAGPRNAASTAAQVVAMVNAADYPGLYRLKRALEADLTSAQGFICHGFLTLAWARQTSTFGFGAQAADAIFNRYRLRRTELLGILGERPYVRLIADAAVAYTRIGRYADARELLDREIAAGLADLLPVRAEVSWIHDPERAADDIDRHIKRVGARSRQGEPSPPPASAGQRARSSEEPAI